MKIKIILMSCALLACALLAMGGQQFTPKPGDDIIPGEYIVKFRDDASPVAVLNSIDPTLKIIRPAALGARLVSLPSVNADTLLGRIAAHAGVEWVEPNHRRKVQVTNPTDTSFASQYALSIVEAVNAWATVPGAYLTSDTAGSGRLRVAVIDTGIDCTHPDFKNAGGTSVDSAQGGQIAMSASRAFVQTTISSPACAFQDDHGHGTHTAGIIAAATNNARGVAGLAFPAELMVIKALDGLGFGNDATIATSIIEAVDGGARIISMSLGGTGYSQNIQDALKYAYQRGVLVVAAAGNYNSSNLFYPGDSNYALAVAATDSANAKAYFSNWGNWIGIAAPGVNVLSTITSYNLGDGLVNYATMSGTSMSTPYVAALAALVQMTSPGLGVTGTVQQMQRSASSALAGGGWQQTLGYGVISAAKAVNGSYRNAAYGSIRGQVTNSSGTPLANAVVRAGAVSFTTAADGLFRLANLLPGPVTVATSVSGYSSDTRFATVVAGADTPLNITLNENRGVYTGTVTSGGLPVSPAIVEVLTNGLVVAATVTSQSGDYTVDCPTGSHSLRVSAFGFGTTTKAAPSLTSGNAVAVQLTLTPGGTINGTVRDSSGSPLQNLQVLAQTSGYQKGAVTNSKGEYEISGLPAGTYDVSAGTTSVTGVEVAAGATVPVNLGFGTPTLALTPEAVVLAGGQTQQFTAKGGGLPVVWSISPASGTISSGGLYTAPAGTAAATITVRATSQADPNLSAVSTVLVNGKLTLTLGSSSVVGGNNVTNCQIILSSPAPQGGLVVALSSSDPSVANPLPNMGISGNNVMSIPAGSVTSGTFQIATYSVTDPTSVNITASALGMASAAPLTIKPVGLLAVSLGQASVSGGTNAISNVVWIDGPAPAGGITISLSTNDAAAQLPSTVKVNEGSSSSNTFVINTTAVASTKVVRINATYNGVTRWAELTILGSGGANKLTLSPTSVRGGTTTTTNSITLASAAPSGGVTVSLTSSDPATAGVPAAVTVPAGSTSTTFSITTNPVAVNVDVQITATTGGSASTGVLTVRAPALTMLYIRLSSVGGGSTVTSNRVTLDAPAPPGGISVALSSSSPLAAVPAGIVVPEGQTVSTYFDVVTRTTPSAVDVTLTASANGVVKTDALTVRPPIVSSLVFSPSSVVGPSATTSNRVGVDGPAPAGGLTVALSSSDPSVSVPGAVVIPEGQTTAYFTATAATVDVSVTATITASMGGVSRTATLTVRAPALSSVATSPYSVVGGTPASNSRVYLDGPAPPGGALVYLTSSDPALVPVQATVVVPPGTSLTPYLAVPTMPVSSVTVVTVTATYKGVSKTDTLELRPATF